MERTKGKKWELSMPAYYFLHHDFFFLAVLGFALRASHLQTGAPSLEPLHQFPYALLPGYSASPRGQKLGASRPWTETSEIMSQNISSPLRLFSWVFITAMKELTNAYVMFYSEGINKKQKKLPTGEEGNRVRRQEKSNTSLNIFNL
jgi:hypothetical protein